MQKLRRLPESATLRAFSLLEHIVRAELPLSLDELTQQCGLPKPTVYRILGLLLQGGLLQREPSGKRYAVASRLADAALELLMHSPLRARRHAILVRLVDQIGETCNFTMLDGDHAVYLDRVETSSPVRLLMEAGSRVPLHCTASGKLFLSQLAEKTVHELLGPGPFKRYTERTITEPDRLARELKKIRGEGVGRDVGEYLEGSVCLAVPVVDAKGRVCATVAVHGPAPRMTLKRGREFLPALRQAALEMSETLVADAPADARVTGRKKSKSVP
ncbi:MAG TPA: IclR family transcriptional regulator [Rhodocyclaceae bacterium]|nr:IclR family transcriptional regulator [Rhodocyclaceae bacterium]